MYSRKAKTQYAKLVSYTEPEGAVMITVSLRNSFMCVMEPGADVSVFDASVDDSRTIRGCLYESTDDIRVYAAVALDMHLPQITNPDGSRYKIRVQVKPDRYEVLDADADETEIAQAFNDSCELLAEKLAKMGVTVVD
jgi:hypothetical protein